MTGMRMMYGGPMPSRATAMADQLELHTLAQVVVESAVQLETARAALADYHHDGAERDKRVDDLTSAQEALSRAVRNLVAKREAVAPRGPGVRR